MSKNTQRSLAAVFILLSIVIVVAMVAHAYNRALDQEMTNMEVEMVNHFTHVGGTQVPYTIIDSTGQLQAALNAPTATQGPAIEPVPMPNVPAPAGA